MSTTTTGPRRGRRTATAREIGEKFGRSPRTIRRVLAEDRSNYEARAAERHQRIQQLRAEGLSMRAIAEREGVAVGTVAYALKKSQTAPAA